MLGMVNSMVVQYVVVVPVLLGGFAAAAARFGDQTSGMGLTLLPQWLWSSVCDARQDDDCLRDAITCVLREKRRVALQYGVRSIECQVRRRCRETCWCSSPRLPSLD